MQTYTMGLLNTVKENVLKPYLVKKQVESNQKQLFQVLEKHEVVHLTLQPAFGCPGSPQHYYHFLFDVVMPLYTLINKSPSNRKFFIDQCGSFNEYLVDFFPDKMLSRDELTALGSVKGATIIGMNPRAYRYKSQFLQGFKQTMLKTFDIKPSPNRNTIVLIQRVAPSQQFLEKTVVATSAGSMRRSIPNHSLLVDYLQSRVDERFELKNVALENLNMKEQIELFDSAALVIGQHGAGLANTIFMNPKTAVIEISHLPQLTYFKKLTSDNNIEHHLYKTEAKHQEIDLDDLNSWINSNASLNKFFKEN